MDKRFILNALLETKPNSLRVAAVTAGMATFSGRGTPVGTAFRNSSFGGVA
jgi:hypothetical protein